MNFKTKKTGIHLMARLFSIVRLFLLLFYLLLPHHYALAADASIELTTSEKVWLQQHPVIRLGYGTEFAPAAMLDDEGKPYGALVETYQAINQQLDINIQLDIAPWKETVDKVERGELDGYMMASQNRVKNSDHLASNTISNTYVAVYARNDSHIQITSLAQLQGNKIAYMQGDTAITDSLGSLVNDKNTVTVNSNLAGMEQVVLGKVDAFISYTSSNYLISAYQLPEIKLVYIDLTNAIEGVASVRSDWPELVGIINKGLKAVGKAKLLAIWRNWGVSSTGGQVELSSTEEAWLQSHPEITLGFRIMPPLVIEKPDGSVVGVIPELIKAVFLYTGVNIKLKIGPWKEVINDVLAGNTDGVFSASPQAIDKMGLLAANSYLRGFSAVYMRKKRSKSINSLEDLIGMRVSILDPSMNTQSLRNHYKDQIEFVPSSSILEGLIAVSSGKADAYMGLNIDNYYLAEYFIPNIEIAYMDNENVREGPMGIRQDWPQLVSILNKGMAAIGDDRIMAIINKWSQLKPEQRAITASERAWLAQLPTLNYGVLPDQYPFEEMNVNGQHAGLISDILALLQKQLKLTINTTETSQLPSLKQKLKTGSVSIAGLVAKNLKTEEDYVFSEPFIELPLVLVSRKDSGFNAGLESMNGQIVAVRKDTASEQLLKEDFPDVTVLAVMDDQQGLLVVESAQADAFLITAARADYLMRSSGSEVLKLAATTQYKQPLVFAVEKSLKKLVPILNIQLAGISKRERGLMLAKWLNIKVETKTDWEKVLLWGGLSTTVFLFVIGYILYANRRLAKEMTVRIQSEKKAKQSEKKAKQSEKKAEDANKAKSTFLANMSHELRTPLNAVIGFSQLLQRQPGIPANAIEDIKTIHSSGQHLLGLINDVLDMAKIEAGKTTLVENDFDCHKLFFSVERMFALQMQQKGLKLQLEGVEELPLYIKTDERKLTQAILNLLSNAYKFTAQGSIVVRVHFDEPELIIEVEDNGSGIAEDEIEKIFKAFGQSESGKKSQQGTGLGLPISRQFARLMGGDLTVTSEKGKGSVFCLKVKVETVEAMGKSSDTYRVIGLAPGQKSYRILVVDDCELNCIILSRLLKQMGFTVETTDNGPEAIERADSWHPHLIFMDQRMPKMKGDEATRIIKAAHPEIIIIALSASVLKEAEANVVAAGGDAFIRKPYKENEIFDVMKKYLQVEYEIVDVKPEAASPEVSEDVNDVYLQQLLLMTDAVWRQKLKRATYLGDIKEAKLLVADIADEHPELAAGLQELLQIYQHGKISGWLE